jgi:hypothetical protein
MKCSLACCGWTQTRAAKLLVCLTVLTIATCVSACASTSRAKLESNSSSLESYIRRVRALSAESSHKSTPSVPTVESWNPRLSAALLKLAFQPTAEQHRRRSAPATEYSRPRLRPSDAALRPKFDDAAAFDARARIWRDWVSLNRFERRHARCASRRRLPPPPILGTLWQALGNVAGQALA